MHSTLLQSGCVLSRPDPRRRARPCRRAGVVPAGRADRRGPPVHQAELAHADAIGARPAARRSRPEDPARPGRAGAGLPRRRRKPRRGRAEAARRPVGRGSPAHRAAHAAERSLIDPRARPALRPLPVRRARRPLQRDVRVGQLFHPGRSAARRRAGSRARHGRQLRLRDRPLRHDPQREPHVFPVPLAAAVPDRDDPGRLRPDRRPRVAAVDAAGDRAILPVLDAREPHAIEPTSGCRATSTSATGPAPEVVSDEKDAQRPDALRPGARVLPDPRGDRLRRVARTTTARGDRLTDLFYKGDRSMRESGFDPSNRFGALNVDDHPLRAGLPEHAALQHGRGRGADHGRRSATLRRQA